MVAPDLRVDGAETRHRPVALGKSECLHRSEPSQDSAGHRIAGLKEHGQHHPCGSLVVCKVTQASHRRFLSAFDTDKVHSQPRFGGG
ncbi:hypothetical protein GCM10010407_12670 [Rarobacter incanus]